MNPIFTIAKKELRDMFYSPIAYVFTTVFLFLSFWLFFSNLFPAGQASLRMLFIWVPILFLLFLPSITMGKWAEEKKTGTQEILLTLPITDLEVILGKFLSSLIFVIFNIVLLLTAWVTVSLYGEVDQGPVLGGAIGLILLASACLSIGLFISSCTENQIIAFILTTVSLFILYLLGEPLVLNYMPEFLKPLLSYSSLSSHFASITRGVIDSRDVLYYLSVTGFFLFLNFLSIESRKWNDR